MDPNTNAEKKESTTSPTELFSSVQVLGQAAVSTINKEQDKVDKAKAAAAAEDLLQAASQYGKLENTSYGEYVEKAEGYIHQYSEPGVTKKTTETEQVKTATPASEDGGAKEPAAPTPEVKTATPAPEDGGAKEAEKKEESSGGVESYVKMAEGLVNKEGGDSAADKSEGGFGGALKMAGGFFK